MNYKPKKSFSLLIFLTRIHNINLTITTYQFWLQQDQQKHDNELQGVTPFYSAFWTIVVYKQVPVFHQLLLLQQYPRILQVPLVCLSGKKVTNTIYDILEWIYFTYLKKGKKWINIIFHKCIFGLWELGDN